MSSGTALKPKGAQMEAQVGASLNFSHSLAGFTEAWFKVYRSMAEPQGL